MIFGDRVHRSSLREIGGDRCPRFSAICALDEVRRQVIVLPGIEGSEDCVGGMSGGKQMADIGHLGNSFEFIDLLPVLTAVLSNLNQSIICSHVDESFNYRRLRELHDVSKQGG